ncbi:MAG: efflux RND transporter periplasmic adaptor subunit, partial [Chitinophagales bacterium]|nr:efflux RND transporter periplasmic adaptor subunit [Chitinophagales bacterium]
VSSEVSGEITQLLVKEGDSVQKGDLLAVINPSIYESLVAQSEATLNQAKANLSSARANFIQAQAQFKQAQVNFNRNNILHAQKVISDAEFENFKLQLEQAEAAYKTAQEQVNAATFNVASVEAQVKQSKENLLRTKIYAPISGIITSLNVKQGERVVGTAQMTGTEMMRISDLDNMLMYVDVNENDVLRVHVGDTADVEVDAYPGEKFKAVVAHIAYSSSASSLLSSQATNFTVKLQILRDSYVDLLNRERGLRYPFRPGMSATADIKTNFRENVLAVPIQAVTIREDEESKLKRYSEAEQKGDENLQKKRKIKEIVFVTDGKKVAAVPVKTGIQDAAYIEITDGLKEGIAVVKAPFRAINKELSDGDPIQIVSEKELFSNSGD